jgi:hypothetical protein
MRKAIPDTWAYFFGIVLVEVENKIDMAEPVNVYEFLDRMGGFRVFDETKYRQRFIFFKIPS